MIVETAASRRLSRLAAAVLTMSLAAIASADCMRDLRGEVYCGAGRCLVDNEGKVWCSRHLDGDAEKTLDGRVLCGRGDCERDVEGEMFCSSVVAGAVLIDGRGRVRCYGECEPATAENCESTRADSSDDAA